MAPAGELPSSREHPARGWDEDSPSPRSQKPSGAVYTRHHLSQHTQEVRLLSPALQVRKLGQRTASTRTRCGWWSPIPTLAIQPSPARRVHGWGGSAGMEVTLSSNCWGRIRCCGGNLT